MVNFKKICGIQGAYYNKRATKLYGPELLAFKGVTEATKDLRAGNCQGFIYDNTWIESKLASGDWDDYEMVLPTEDFSLWAVGVRLDDLDGPFGRFMSGVVYQWLRSGKLSRPHDLIAAFALERFNRGFLIEEKAHGPIPNLSLS